MKNMYSHNGIAFKANNIQHIKFYMDNEIPFTIVNVGVAISFKGIEDNIHLWAFLVQHGYDSPNELDTLAEKYMMQKIFEIIGCDGDCDNCSKEQKQKYHNKKEN